MFWVLFAAFCDQKFYFIKTLFMNTALIIKESVNCDNFSGEISSLTAWEISFFFFFFSSCVLSFYFQFTLKRNISKLDHQKEKITSQAFKILWAFHELSICQWVNESKRIDWIDVAKSENMANKNFQPLFDLRLTLLNGNWHSGIKVQQKAKLCKEPKINKNREFW